MTTFLEHNGDVLATVVPAVGVEVWVGELDEAVVHLVVVDPGALFDARTGCVCHRRWEVAALG